MFRKAESKDLDTLQALIVVEAERGCFDPRLAEEPYRSGLRQNLNHIRKKGRRRDEDVAAQLLVWESAGKLAGCLINSAIVGDTGNEIWMIAVSPQCRGQGEGSRMLSELLAALHPRVDIFARCAPGAELALQLFLRRGFLPLDTTGQGVRVLKLPKVGAPLAAQQSMHQTLEPFVPVPLK